MYNYKGLNEQACHNARAIITFLLVSFFARHLRCAGKIVGQKVSHVAIVPSSKPQTRKNPVPLRSVLAEARRFTSVPPEIELEYKGDGKAHARSLGSKLFSFNRDRMMAVKHLLVLDDTWVTGATALTAVQAARKVTCAPVSALVVCRWLNFDPHSTSEGKVGFKLAEEMQRQNVYDFERCPFTGSCCP